MLTPEAVASDWVNREIGYALAQRRLRDGVGTITASDIDYVAFKKPAVW